MIPFKQWLIEKAHRGMKFKMNMIFYRTGSETRDSETEEGIQGLQDALKHDLEYGGKDRADSTTRSWWQGASIALDWADQATQMTPTVANFRNCYDAISHYADDPNNVIAITSATVFRDLQSQIEGQRNYNARGRHAKYGFTSFEIDDIEVFKEPWLTNTLNSDRATHLKHFYMLHLPDWRLFLDAERKMGQMTDFKWQGEIQGGKDEYLARIMFRGNLICSQPNASIFKSNVTF